jgi:sialate O-acetylesterase
MKTKNLKISAVCALSAAALTCCAAAVAGFGWKSASAETVPTYETLCADYNGASTEAFFDEGDSLQSGKKYIGFKCNGEESDYSALCDAYSSIDAGESFTALKEGGKVVLDFGFSSEIFDGGCALKNATVFLSGTRYSVEFYAITDGGLQLLGNTSTTADDKAYSFHSVSASASENINALQIVISGGAGQSVTVREIDLNFQNDPAEIKAVKDELNKYVTLPSLFSDNMILKQRSYVKVWGYGGGADGNAVTVSIGGQSKTATVKNYEWSVTLDPLCAGYDYTLKVAGKHNETEIKNVAAGEVFIAAGQSNMQRTVKKLDGADDADYIKGYGSEEIADLKDNPQQSVRLFNQSSVSTRNENLKDVVSSGWSIADFDSAYNFSAVGYFFARELTSRLNVPVGVIYAAVGGTRIQGWYSREKLLSYGDSEISNEQQECVDFYAGDTSAYSSKSACNYFNGMIKPLMPYTLSGILWYQGESNVGDYKIYHKMMEILEDGWREGFCDPELKFLTVQVAPYDRSGYNHHRIAVSQNEMIYLLKNTYLTVISDTPWEAGNDNIHPQNKVPVGVRLSDLARQFIYGEDINALPPLFGGADISGGIVTVKVNNVSGELKTTDGEEPVGFELSEDGKTFYPASATIVSDAEIAVWDYGIPEPAFIRYGYNPAFTGTVTDGRGVPLGIFATDTFLFDLDEPRKITSDVISETVAVAVQTGGRVSLPETVSYILGGEKYSVGVDWALPEIDTAKEGEYIVRGFSTEGRFIVATAKITVSADLGTVADLTALWIALGAVATLGAGGAVCAVIIIKKRKG